MPTTFADFAYLAPLANAYQEMVAPHEIRAAAANLNGQAWTELTAAYMEIAERKDGPRISEWISSARRRASQEGIRCHEAWDVRRLFLLFDALAVAGIPPFASRRVVLEESSPSLNWNDAPPEMQYLKEVVDTFAVYCGHEDDLHCHASAEEFAIMENAAAHVRAHGGVEWIMDWFLESEDRFIVGLVLAMIESMGFALT